MNTNKQNLAEELAEIGYLFDHAGYLAWAQEAWDDMGGPEPSEERASRVADAYLALTSGIPDAEISIAHGARRALDSLDKSHQVETGGRWTQAREWFEQTLTADLIEQAAQTMCGDLWLHCTDEGKNSYREQAQRLLDAGMLR